MLDIGYQPALVGPQATPDRIRELALRAESAGFTRLSVTDHLVLPLEQQTRYPYHSSGSIGPIDQDWWDPFAVLGLWVGTTSTIRLQTSVLVLPYRPVIPTAKLLASLDALSGGRLEVGVGTGWMEEEFELLQAPPFAERGRVANEYIAAFRTLWRDPEPEFEGEYVRFGPLALHPKPAQGAALPILIGGTTKPAMRRAARLGDGWQPLKLDAPRVAAGLEVIRSEADAAGRVLPENFQVSVRYGVRISESTERRPGEDEDRVLVGPPQEIVAGLRALGRAGATDVMLDSRTCSAVEVDATLEAFERDVLPALAVT